MTSTKLGFSRKAYVFRLYQSGEILQTFPLGEEHRHLNGAVMAIEDAAVLTRCLDTNNSIDEAARPLSKKSYSPHRPHR